MRLAIRALSFVGPLCFVLAVESLARRESGVEQLHWSSEDLIQTVPLVDLAAEPARSLWYLHVQPPGLELIRAALLPRAESGTDLAAGVDRRLSLVWAAVYGALVWLTMWWLRQVVPVAQAAATALLVALHPAAILYATVPDTTLLTALLVTWSSYELWRISPSSGSAPRLAAAFIALFLVRSIFQWPALAVFAAAIATRGGGRRRLLLFLALTVPLVGGYSLKQYRLFRITTSTSFTGYNCLRSLGLMPFGFERGQTLEPSAEVATLPCDPRAARVLSTVTKPNGVQNFNHVNYLAANRLLLEVCRREYESRSIAKLASTYAINARLYLSPSSRYASAQPVLAVVGWRSAFDWIFSGARWLILLVVAVAVWLGSSSEQAVRRLVRGLGLALPLLMVAAASVLFERGENMRFRFFLEPVLLVFVSAQASSLVHALSRRLPVRSSGDASAGPYGG